MAAPSPARALPDELERLPIFPLPEVQLFPHSLLPLHVFEPRYRALTRDVLASPLGLLAVPMLEPGFEAQYDGRPAVRPVCGVGEIIQHHQYPDGRYDILLRGLGRVRIVDELPPHQTYRLVRARRLPDASPGPGASPGASATDEPGAIEARLEPALRSLRALCDKLAATIPERGETLRALVRQERAPGAAVDVIAAALVTEPDERQALIEEPDPAARLDQVMQAVARLVARFATRTTTN